MPTLEFSGIMTAYVVIALLLLSLNVYSRWSWWIKVLTNLVVVSFFWITYTSFPQLLGWPTQQGLPKQFVLHAVNIDEPQRIFIWGTDLDRGLGRTVPRAYELAYNKTLHERVDIAARKLRKGIPVIGEISEGAMSAVARGEEIVQSKVNEVDIVFLDAPQSLVPQKN